MAPKSAKERFPRRATSYARPYRAGRERHFQSIAVTGSDRASTNLHLTVMKLSHGNIQS